MVLLLLVALSLGDTKPAVGKPTRQVLYEMPLESGPNLPESYGRALAVFDEAKKDYEKGKSNKAAPKFMQVAELLKAPSPDSTYAKSFAKMRGIAYQDASIAYDDAGLKAERKKQLEAALAKDPESKETLEKLLQR